MLPREWPDRSADLVRDLSAVARRQRVEAVLRAVAVALPIAAVAGRRPPMDRDVHARRRHARDRVAGRIVWRVAGPEPDGLDTGRRRAGRGGGLPLEPQRRNHGGGTAEASRSGGAVDPGKSASRVGRDHHCDRSAAGRAPCASRRSLCRGARSFCCSGSWRARARRARRPAGRSADSRPDRVRTARRARRSRRPSLRRRTRANHRDPSAIRIASRHCRGAA